MINGPANRLYQAKVQAGLIQADAAQQQVLQYLDTMALALRARKPMRFLFLLLS